MKLFSLLVRNYPGSVALAVLSTTELSRGQRKHLALLAAYLEDRLLKLEDGKLVGLVLRAMR